MVHNSWECEEYQHGQIRNVEAVDFHAEHCQDEANDNDQKGIFHSILRLEGVQFFVSLTQMAVGALHELSQFAEVLLFGRRKMRALLFETVENVKEQHDEHHGTEGSQASSSNGIEDAVSDQEGEQTGIAIVPENEPFDAIESRIEREDDIFHGGAIRVGIDLK